MEDARSVSTLSGTMLDNGRDVPMEILLTTDLVESQTTVNVSEGRLVEGEKARGNHPSFQK